MAPTWDGPGLLNIILDVIQCLNVIVYPINLQSNW